MPVQPLLSQLLLHNHLGGNASMVNSRQPKGRLTFHPVPPYHNILQRSRQRVSQMKLASDIRRRHNDDKGLLFMVYLRSKIAMLHPEAIPLLLNASRLISLWNFRHIANSSYKVMRPLRVAHHTTSKTLSYNYLFPKNWVTLSRILSP